jgi:hypothetical protein
MVAAPKVPTITLERACSPVPQIWQKQSLARQKDVKKPEVLKKLQTIGSK